MKYFVGLISLIAITLVGCISTSFTPSIDQLNLPAGIEMIPETDQMKLYNPLWSPDGEKIVAGFTELPLPHICLFCESPYSELFVIFPSTNSITSLVRADYEDFFVRSWLPDSKRIAVQSGMGSLGIDTFLIDISDSSIFPPPPYFSEPMGIEWSRDGKNVVIFDWVLYIKRELKIVNLDLYEETILYTITGTNDEYIELSEPSLSPDGRTIAFSYGKSDVDYRSVDTEIYFLDIETKQLTQITHDPSHDNDSPTFSPDGKFLAYQKFYQDSLDWRTVIVELDNDCEWEIPLPSAYTSSWAPDSRRLVMGGEGIYIVDLYQLFGDKFRSGTTCQ